jgi:hypothetical protein
MNKGQQVARVVSDEVTIITVADSNGRQLRIRRTSN